MKWSIVLLLVLSSCGLRQPNICLPETYAEADVASQQEGEPVNLLKWWEQFNDPRLSFLIEQALSCNIDLRVARERIVEARGIYGIEFSYLLPWVDQVDIFNRMRNSETLAEAGFLGGTFVNFFKVGFDSLWEIDLFGKQIDRARAAGMDMIAQAEETRQVHVSVAAEVASLYFDILSYQQRISATQHHIDTETKLADILNDRYEAGFSSALDLSTTLGVLYARKSDVPELTMRKKQAIFALSVLLGQDPEVLQHTFDDDQSLPDCFGKIPLGLPSELLCRRGDVRAAEYRMAAAGARVLAARKELFPTLSLSSFFEFATGFYRRLFNLGSQQWSYTPKLVTPMYTGGNIRSLIKAETASQHQAVLEFELAILNALKEVESGLVGFFEQQARYTAKLEEVNNYKEARRLAEIRYFDGLSDFLFLIELERDLYFAEIDMLASQNDMFNQLMSLYKALGGGWEC